MALSDLPGERVGNITRRERQEVHEAFLAIFQSPLTVRLCQALLVDVFGGVEGREVHVHVIRLT